MTLKSMSEQKLKTDKDGIPIDDPSIRGWSRYFNNRTIRGRANLVITTILLGLPTLQVAKTTLTLMLVGTMYYRFFHPQKTAEPKA
uniref:Uncharacterized protein n=1 Tax=Anopheles stephensi TaxID=30069 RepID=A0A182Y3V2_ANOST